MRCTVLGDILMQKSTNDLLLSLIVLSAIAALLLYNFTKPFLTSKEEISSPITTSKVEIPKLVLSDAEWKQRLTPLQFEIMRQGKSEPAFSGKYVAFSENGTYLCSACALPLFSSVDKSLEKTGWPTFTKPIDGKNIILKKESSFLGDGKIIVYCALCDSHLGHIEDNANKPREPLFSINSAALNFIPAPASPQAPSQVPSTQSIGK